MEAIGDVIARVLAKARLAAGLDTGVGAPDSRSITEPGAVERPRFSNGSDRMKEEAISGGFSLRIGEAHAVQLAVPLTMVEWAKPHNVERFAIIIVVSMDQHRRATAVAGLPLDQTLAQSGLDGLVCSALFRFLRVVGGVLRPIPLRVLLAEAAEAQFVGSVAFHRSDRPHQLDERRPATTTEG
jgi:hypothetical protein